MVVPMHQWLIRWGCLAIIAVGTVMQTVGMGAPYWIKDQARPPAYRAFLRILHNEGVKIPGLDNNGDGNTNVTATISRAWANVGLWRWCAEVEVEAKTERKEEGEGASSSLASSFSTACYGACRTPGMTDFPGWWRACQAMAVVGTLMGILACICAGMEIHYTRRGVRFSGLAVLCAISCFVAAVGMGLSHGMFATRYTEQLISVLHLPSLPGPPGGWSFLYPPSLGWAFGLGAAGASLVGCAGLALVAFITRTYPAYHRTENVVV